MSEPFFVDIAALDYDPHVWVPRRGLDHFRQLFRSGDKPPPINVRPSAVPGRYRIHSGAVVMRAAELEGLRAVECIIV